MADIREKINLLVQLQEKDYALDRIRAQAAVIPAKIAEKNAAIAQIRAGMEERKKTLQQHQLKRKEKEIELDSKDNVIRKHSTELNSVKTNDAYRALLTEIDAGKAAKAALENEILDLMEAIEKEAAAVKESEKEFKRQEAEVQSGITQFDDELKKLQPEIARLESERQQFVAQIPEDMLRHYEFVRENRDGVGIAAIEGENCGGCHMLLRPQAINEVCKGQEMVVCDSCSRILYKK